MSFYKIAITLLFVWCCLAIPNHHLRFLEENNCLKVDNDGKCTECAYRYVLKDCKCELVSNYCKIWDQITGKCTDCYGGYTLTDGSCNVSG